MDFFNDGSNNGGSKSNPFFSPNGRRNSLIRHSQGTPTLSSRNLRRLQAMQAETAIKLGIPYAPNPNSSLSSLSLSSSSQHSASYTDTDGENITSSATTSRQERFQSIMDTALSVAYDDINKRNKVNKKNTDERN